MSRVIDVPTCYYPESDGKPIGETDRHVATIMRHCELLMLYFAGQDVYVSRNLLLYYEQGNPKKFVVPDTFVVKGTKPFERRTFKTWIELKVPNVAIEVTSRKTRKKDTTEKPDLFAKLGIKEYFIFDPEFEYLDPPLMGYRLADGKYEKIEPDESGALISEELQLRLKVELDKVQFYRMDNGERLLTEAELRALAEDKTKLAESRIAAAEAEIDRLKAELAKKSQ